MVEIGILYIKANSYFFVIFIEDGVSAINIEKNDNFVGGISIEKAKYKQFKFLSQIYIPITGEEFNSRQKRKILKFLFKEF